MKQNDILDLSFLLLSAIEFLRNSAIQVKFIIIIIIIMTVPNCRTTISEIGSYDISPLKYKDSHFYP